MPTISDRRVGVVKGFRSTSRRTGQPSYCGCILCDDSLDIFVNQNGLECQPGELEPGTLVSFEMERDDRTGKDHAVRLRVVSDDGDLDLLEQCFRSRVLNIWRPAVSWYFDLLNDQAIVEAAAEKLAHVQHDADRRFILQQTPSRILRLQSARPLRDALPAKDHLRLCEEIRRDQGLAVEEWIEQEIKDIKQPPVQHTAESQGEAITKQPPVQHTVESQDKAIAETIQRFYKWPSRKTRWSALQIYRRLSKRDDELALRWCQQSGEDKHELARMLSARGAELAAKEFYGSLGYTVRDAAITQLQDGRSEWRTCDLILDYKIAVDVKNSRFPVNSKERYSEHCVPHFKEDRNSREVRIAGVVSPYLNLENLNLVRNNGTPDFDVSDIAFLGQTDRKRLEALQRQFKREYFVVDLSRQGAVVPAWVFDYPAKYYYGLDKRAGIIRGNQHLLPDLRYFNSICLNPFPAVIGSGIPLPDKWRDDMTEMEREVYRRLLPDENSRPSLPAIFLSILVHFLDTLHTQAMQDYDPRLYRKMLFAGGNELSSWRPLGISDPLRTCWGLCNSLEVLWRERHKTQLTSFREFRFQGNGLLRGRRDGEADWTTILAYCGGWVSGKGKCGYSPLVLGTHELCPKCNRLICPQCDYCSDNCSRRRAEVRRDDGPFDESHGGDERDYIIAW